MSDEDNEDKVSKDVTEAVGVTLSVALALMFIKDDDTMEQSAKMISAGIFSLVKECNDPHQAIGIALACAVGAALLGNSVDELTDVTKMMTEDHEHFQSMRDTFHNLIESIKSGERDHGDEMSFAKPTDSVH
tara:strand:+ start:2521 stop:2916 length:396 start_codon:yes stop_codon:yes gene_type:complete